MWLLRSVDLGELARQLQAAHWGWVLLSAALAPAGLWVRAVRWRYLFPPGSDPPGLVPAIMIGYMTNNVLPLRAGELVRVYVVARRWAARGAALPGRARGFWLALATLVVERVLDSLAVVLMLGALVLVIPVPAFLRAAAVAVLAVDVAGIAVLVLLAWAPALVRRLIARLARRWPGLGQRAVGVFETFLQGLDGVRALAHLPPLLGWTVAVWAVPAGAAWTMLRALDLAVPPLAVVAVLAFVGLGIAVPSAPGYVGVFHAAAALALGLFGVAQSAAVGYAVLFHASQILPVIGVGWLYLLREQLSLREATHAHPPTGA